MEAVWWQSLRAEAGVSAFLHVGAFLWDMSNFYEHFHRGKLVRRALALDFPGFILRLSMLMYKARRLVCFQGVVVEVGYPCRGIVAGDAFATYLVMAYAAEDMGLFCAAHPDVEVTMVIDDLFVQKQQKATYRQLKQDVKPHCSKTRAASGHTGHQ